MRSGYYNRTQDCGFLSVSTSQIHTKGFDWLVTITEDICPRFCGEGLSQKSHGLEANLLTT